VDETATGSLNLLEAPGLPGASFSFERRIPMEETVLEVAARRAKALAQQDWETVAAQLHPQFIYVNASGDRLDRDAYLAFLREGPVRWDRQTLEDAEVIATGPVAVLVATVVDDVVWNGEPARWTFLTTQTYVKDGDAWSYLAGHTALPAA
jgi:Domain of unknown function (DUF4440)